MGAFLLSKGLQLIAVAAFRADTFCARFSNPQQVATCLIAVGLLLGFIKGRFVLSKTVARVVERILSLSLPIRLGDVYAKSYYFLILGMMGLGLFMRFAPIWQDIRGLIDIAVGSALINGAMLYFRRSAYLEER